MPPVPSEGEISPLRFASVEMTIGVSANTVISSGEFMRRLSRGVLFCPLNRGKSSAARIGGGERSELITRMLIMPYGTESKSRNADFISIARKGNPQPSARRAVKLKNLKNPFPLWYCVPPSPRRRWDNHRGPKAPSNLRTLRPRGRSILRTFFTTFFYNPSIQPAAEPRPFAPSGRIL